VFCKKKRYIGRLVWKEGKTHDESKHGLLVDVVGFESRRSDTSKFTKSFQKELFLRILKEQSKKEIFDFINDQISKFRDLPIVDIAMPKSFSKGFDEYLGGSANSIFIKAAKWSNLNMNYDFGGGSKGLFIYTKRPSVPNGVVFMRGDEEKLDVAGVMVDYNLMIEKTVYDKVSTMFEALGLDREELETGLRQCSLSEWF
jgi:DNA polymerase elongation subunit (family B)